MAIAIQFLISNFPLNALILAILLAIGARYIWKTNRSFAEGMTLYLFLLPVGLAGLWGFGFHAFAPDFTAESIGWQPSPFQFEVAVANLGVGLAGIFAFWRKNIQFCLGVLIVETCFLWGAAYGHIKDIIVAGNWAPSNAGSILWTDILIPIFLIVSMIFWKRNQQIKLRTF